MVEEDENNILPHSGQQTVVIMGRYLFLLGMTLNPKREDHWEHCLHGD